MAQLYEKTAPSPPIFPGLLDARELLQDRLLRPGLSIPVVAFDPPVDLASLEFLG